ncbi:SigE family RNA polymerase sigma factor [Micromonospora sp. FIMYZ51]|uniref:SigE family RNA polymerase sigma factor n=1 Tax=Micromonospora sp. FIMYZ51 TaxID=3051832 RepID=UPI00311D862C
MADSDPLEEEFRDFVTARSGALLRSAYLLTGDWGTAEDLLQTALTKTYLAWKRLGGIEAIEPYARRVMVNTSTSWWRRRWHGERPTAVLPERAAADVIEQQLDRDVLWRHLRALPARQRAVLVLRFYEDMSEAQTAALLNISPGTVKSQTSRALATLRRRIGTEEALVLPGSEAPSAAPPPTAVRATTGRSGARTTANRSSGTPATANRSGTPATANRSSGTPATAGRFGQPSPVPAGDLPGRPTAPTPPVAPPPVEHPPPVAAQPRGALAGERR